MTIKFICNDCWSYNNHHPGTPEYKTYEWNSSEFSDVVRHIQETNHTVSIELEILESDD